MAFRWRADDGPLLVVFGSSLPSSTKKTLSKLDPRRQNFLDPRMSSVPAVLESRRFFKQVHAPTYRDSIMSIEFIVFITLKRSNFAGIAVLATI